MIKVVKFGGSSVANAGQFKKIKQIIEDDPSRKFIVTSACGKEGKEDHKVTDLLYLAHAHVKYGVSYESIFSLIEAKYESIKKDLGLTTDLKKEFDLIKSLMNKNMDVDYLVSRGEYLTARLLAEYLDADFVDAAKVISFNYDGSINMEHTEALLKEHIKPDRKMVVPGFYGFLPNGVVKVMSRGGSDISGAILANIVDADVYENWTDVSGFLVADPRIVENPQQIKHINYAELREMSYMGANVLHDEAIFPVKKKNIPINIRNTNDFRNPGTMIMDNCDAVDAVTPPPAITGITGKKHFTAITASKSGIANEVGFLRKVLTIFENYHLSVETMPVGVDSFSVIVETEQVKTCIYELLSTLKEELELDEVFMDDHLALLAIVGRGMKARTGMSGQLFAELGDNDINIRIINQGSDEISIMIGIDNRDFEKAIKCVYSRFIK